MLKCTVVVSLSLPGKEVDPPDSIVQFALRSVDSFMLFRLVISNVFGSFKVTHLYSSAASCMFWSAQIVLEPQNIHLWL